MKKKIIAAACMLALGTAAYAGEGEVKDRHGFYGYLGIHNLDLDSYHQVGERVGSNMGIGWAFNKNWQLEGTYGYTDGLAKTIRPDLITYSLDALYNDTSWIGSTETHPFIKVGYGKHDDKYNQFDPLIEDEFYKAGIGIQHFANDSVFMRVGYDFLDSGDRGDDKMAYFNIGLFLGETVRTAAAPKVEPKKEAKDSDGDGVLDADDRCPGTPAGAAVDAYGCALDSDGDGVADYKDACPGTAAGAKVDEKGCEIKDQPAEEVVVDMRLNFDVNKYAIKPEMVSEIAKVAEFLRQYPDVDAEIQGHTDSTGSNQYNQGLSERRANSVKDYLINNFGIEASRLTAVGYGEERPIGDNATEEGRALNRRVEANAKAMK